MGHVVRFGIAMDSDLLATFDAAIARRGYGNRSEAIRDLVRDSLVAAGWSGGRRKSVGVITLVYEHETRDLDRVLTALQHRNYRAITSALHVHLDRHHCLEVLVVRASAARIKKIADLLISTKGVKHGTLSATTTGEGIP
ncbi:MAG: nickel-responsive transcriptional regulator NikR [Acidobacteriota bacterium]